MASQPVISAALMTAGMLLYDRAACAGPRPCTRSLCARKVEGAYRVSGWNRSVTVNAGGRLLEGVIEYALEEKRLLVARAELDALRTQSEALAERIARLEKRLDRLAGGR